MTVETPNVFKKLETASGVEKTTVSVRSRNLPFSGRQLRPASRSLTFQGANDGSDRWRTFIKIAAIDGFEPKADKHRGFGDVR